MMWYGSIVINQMKVGQIPGWVGMNGTIQCEEIVKGVGE